MTDEERIKSLEARVAELEKALNQITVLAVGGLAYTREFTEHVEKIACDVLGKRWPV